MPADSSAARHACRRSGDLIPAGNELAPTWSAMSCECDTPLAAARLGELYDLNGVLLDACLARLLRAGAGAEACRPPSRPLDHALGTTSLFAEIALAQSSRELARCALRTGERLFRARSAELRVFPAAVESHLALCVLWDRRDIRALRHLVGTHHEVRMRRADAIARAMNDAIRSEAA